MQILDLCLINPEAAYTTHFERSFKPPSCVSKKKVKRNKMMRILPAPSIAFTIYFVLCSTIGGDDITHHN